MLLYQLLFYSIVGTKVLAHNKENNYYSTIILPCKQCCLTASKKEQRKCPVEHHQSTSSVDWPFQGPGIHLTLRVLWHQKNWVVVNIRTQLARRQPNGSEHIDMASGQRPSHHWWIQEGWRPLSWILMDYQWFVDYQSLTIGLGIAIL